MNEDDIREKIRIEEDEREKIIAGKKTAEDEELKKGCLPAILGLIAVSLIFKYVVPAIQNLFKS